jgi:hypothetical protein
MRRELETTGGGIANPTIGLAFGREDRFGEFKPLARLA